MKTLLFTLSFLMCFTCLTSHSWALPPCPTDTNTIRGNCFGTNTFANGNKYIGEYKGFKRQGQGTFIWKNGEKYIGEFKNDMQHGQGLYTYPTGAKYKGNYLEGKKNGQGIYTYASGKIEDGEWKNSKLNGYAILYDVNGSILKEGIWKDDKFLYTQKKSTPTSNSKIEEYKSFCSEIGFTPGTEKFGECVVEVMKKG